MSTPKKTKLDDIADAVNALKQQGRIAQANIRVMEALENIGSLEQAASDAKQRTDALAGERRKTITRLDNSIEAKGREVRELESEILRANGEVTMAGKKAKEILEEATTSASAIIDNANAAFAAAQVQIAKDRDQSQAERNEIHDEFSAAMQDSRDRHAQLLAAIDAKEKDLASLDARLTEAREAARKLIGV